MHIFDNLQLSVEEQSHLIDTYPEQALTHAIGRLRLSKYPVRSQFSFLGKVANDFCRLHNITKQHSPVRSTAASNLIINNQKGESSEVNEHSEMYNSAPSQRSGERPSLMGPRGHRPEGHRPVGHRPNTTFNKPESDSWKVKNYPIQKIADEIRGWQKVLNSYKIKETPDANPSPLKGIFGESGEAFAKAKLKELIDEFQSRPSEEQALAE